MSDKELADAIREHTAEIRKLADRYDEKKLAGETPSGELDGMHEVAGKATAADSKKYSADQSAALRDERERQADEDERIAAAVKAALKNTRIPSLAAAIGAGPAPSNQGAGRFIGSSPLDPHPVMKASFRDYQAGEFILGIMNYKGVGLNGIDIDTINLGKAALASLGVRFGGVPTDSKGTLDGYMVDENGKATLGTTGATGGYVLPNNLVDTLVKPNTQKAVYQLLVTIRNGINVRGVDMPYRLGAPSRMTFQDWGATKTNVNEGYGLYTANLGTLGAIYDISKQYARFSAGSAEQDIIDELSKAAILGENYYMIAGASISGSVGSGDPTYGIYTALNAATSFNGYSKAATTSASSSTWLGSLANVLTQAQGYLAGRNRQAEAHVVDSATYWVAVGQGSDNAGPWAAPVGDGGPTQVGPIPGFGRTPSGGLTYWGVPVYYDANLGTNATTKIIISGEFSALKLFRGMEFRIDTSDQAGTRWDQNLIGFRGEEEIGFNAATAVNTGALQLMTSVVP